ncbi:MAG TPA: hypothetical protein VKX16_09250 [Chloroflexota bacterium]|nr:hypothetical protein [Chloroflexota bacterium]
MKRHRIVFVGLVSVSLAIGVLLTLPHRAAAGTRSGWVASASLSVFSRGKWLTPTNSNVDSLGLLRVRLVVKGQGAAGPNVEAHVSMSHLSWQGSRKVIMPPNLVATMKRTSASGSTATFETVVRIPTMLPGGWGVVDVTVIYGHNPAHVRTRVFIDLPAIRTDGNSVTIPTAARFCAKAPRLHHIPYAVFMHGYYVTLDNADGPPTGITLDRPRRLPANILAVVGSYPHGLLTGGGPPAGVEASLGPKGSGWYTSAGELDCDMGRPSAIVLD